MYRPDGNHVYNAHATDDICFHGSFDTLEAAIDGIKNCHSGNEFCILKAKINEFENVTDITGRINEQGELYDLWNLYNDKIHWSIFSSYAWIPHHYAIGDMIRSSVDGTFAVIVDNGRCPSSTTALDINDMTLKCVSFEKNKYHSCGGALKQDDFSILRIESVTETELEECPKELIRFSHLVKGVISPAEFLEEYSQGIIGKYSSSLPVYSS